MRGHTGGERPVARGELGRAHEDRMPKKLLILVCALLLAHCSSAPAPKALTVEQERRLARDTAACNEKADDSSRGFGVGGITWTLKWQEIFNYCMKTKGWDGLAQKGFTVSDK